ncbi:MAG TPA: DUF4404 family protein [Ignavibacteriaceae bacterium]|nr:DUF4404 family protein [Ignavibacteriaceae bacterium]
MPNNELENLLKKLKLEINNIDSTDESSLEKLSNIKDEIEYVLENGVKGLKSEESSLLDRLEDFVENFEASHPELTAKMNNIINFMNNLGL